MELKNLLESIDRIENLDENPMIAPMAMDTPKPSMSVNINAQGADNIKDILSVLQNIESGIDGLDRDGDADHDMQDHEMESYENEPEEDVKDVDYMVNQLAGGMNRPKGTHTKVGGGDNPLQAIDDLEESIRSELLNRLQNIKEQNNG